MSDVLVNFHWFDCSTSFDCPCGEREIYLDDSETEYQCQCGRIYKFTCKLDQINENLRMGDDNGT